jgi:hypothetical protein
MNSLPPPPAEDEPTVPGRMDEAFVAELLKQISYVRKQPAKARALRTLAQGALFTGPTAAGEVVFVASTGGHLDWRALLVPVAQAAGTAVLSYLHRAESE